MNDFAAASYLIVGTLYLGLDILLLTTWRGRRLGGYLIAACAISALWAMTMAASARQIEMPVMVAYSLEVLRSGVWLIFLAALCSRIGIGKLIIYGANVAWIGVLIAGYALLFGNYYFGLTINLGDVLIPGGLVMSLMGLLLIEQLFRNSPEESRWGLKPLVVGVGGLFAYDLFLYSQGMLFNAIDPSIWIPRGAANILFVPLIAIAIRRNPTWNLDIFVSRHVVFYTTSFMAVGLYMLVMGLGGYMLKLYGGTWGAAMRILFFVGAGLVLLILLFSSTIRSRFKVLLSKHFYRNKYDYREEWLRLISTLNEFRGSSSRNVLIKALAQIVGSQSGLLWTLSEGGKAYQLVANYHSGNAPGEIPVDDQMIAFVRNSGWLIDLREFEEKPEIYEGLELPAWLTKISKAWLVVPLVARDELVGIILLGKAPVATRLNYEDRDLLKTAGNHIAVHLAQEKSDTRLAEAQQFEAYNRLTAFLMHDLNNLIAQQSLIVSNAEKHKRNPDFVDDAMETIKGSVERMKRLMGQLKGENRRAPFRLTDLRQVIGAAVDSCKDRQPVPVLRDDVDDARARLDPEQLELILCHLIQNAQDATEDEGSIFINLSRDDDTLLLEIADTGGGMSEEFVRERLFRPFDSTKGPQGMGIGVYQAREFARKHGGDLIARSCLGEGTKMIMTFRADRA
jgi:putative PEP-CTERM system histidine kinase